MSALAAFIMRGRPQAVLAIAVLTVISWGLSLASLLAAAAIALPTLRRGGKEGLFLSAMTLPAVALAGQILIGDAFQAAAYTAAMWGPILIVAVILRETNSLALAALGAALLGLLMVAGVFAFVDDPSALWLDHLQQVVSPMLEHPETGMDADLVRQTMAVFSRYVTGAIAAGLVLTLLASLLIARWWQAGLYNPGGFRIEFLQLRLPAWSAYVFLGLLTMAAMASGGVAVFAANMALPVLMIFLIAGFSVMHAVFTRSPSGRFWLTGIYIGLMFISPLVLLIALVGLSDSWINWRQRFMPKTP